MSKYTSQQIRNIVLAGHAGAGKTLLAESLLEAAGAIPSKGELSRGTTVCDFDPKEKELGHSLETSLCHFDHDNIHVNLIDTPGYPDFLGRSIAVLPAAETVAVVVNAQSGVELSTQRIMEAAAGYGMCRMVIINRIDAPDADLHGVLRQVREVFGNECLPLNLPAGGGSKVADCFFEMSEEETDFASVAAAHTEMIDQVVEVDEKLMEIYLEQGEELSLEQLHDPFEQALRSGHLVPICFTSAETGVGVKQLLNVFEKLMPNPMEGNPPHFLKGEGSEAVPVDVAPDPDKHALAHVFKVTVDPFVGKLGIFRIHQGTITPNTQLYIGDARKPFKVAHLLALQGKEHVEVSRGIPGDIRAVAKIDEIEFDSVLHDSHDEDNYHLEPAAAPPPMYGLAIEPTRRGDEQKISEALHKLAAEDPTLVIEHNAVANETVLRGMGELHLRIVMERMKERYNVEIETHPPSIPYRETIRTSAEGHHRHKKQTGGAGQFGEVFLRIEPLARDEGFEFKNKVVGGSIPSQFIPAVEKGVRQVLAEGAVAGFPLQDIRVTVYDGKHHPVDSKEVAFVAAGKKAFTGAVSKAKPVLLEPIVNIEILAPSDSMGDIAGDLSARRGRISGNTVRPSGEVAIAGQVPLAELNDYQSRLKSITGGEGSYTMNFSHYDPVPPQTQKDLQSAFQPGNDD
ncbi:MAG: elongation factor G [Gammaproteobacteria bacterium]|nr:elongation factor G [Gammaproteobacteria bacterium]NNF61361.1 elongation factor G [Gammaproteobacteria bacterium]